MSQYDTHRRANNNETTICMIQQGRIKLEIEYENEAIPINWSKQYLSHFTGLFNTLKWRQNGCRFTDDTFKCIFLNENIIISIKISQKFVPMVRINNTPALVQIMAWRRPGDKPLSGPMMVCLTDAYMRHSASIS